LLDFLEQVYQLLSLKTFNLTQLDPYIR